MFWWACVFFFGAAVAAAFGFGNLEPSPFTDDAQLLFYIFLVLFVVAIIFGVTQREDRIDPLEPSQE